MNQASIENKAPEVLNDFVKKDFKKITTDALLEGVAGRNKQLINEYVNKELTIIDDLIRKGEDFNTIYSKLDDLAKYGDRPEIDLRKALVKIKEKDIIQYKSAMDDINSASNKLKGKNTKFLGEVNEMVSRMEITQKNIETTKQFLDFKAGKTNMLKVEKSTLPKEGKIVEVSEVMKKLQNGEAQIYVGDSPGLNNLNFNAESVQTLSQIMELYPNAILKKIPAESVAKYQPQMVAKIQNLTLTKFTAKQVVELGIATTALGAASSACQDEESCPNIYTLTIPE